MARSVLRWSDEEGAPCPFFCEGIEAVIDRLDRGCDIPPSLGMEEYGFFRTGLWACVENPVSGKAFLSNAFSLQMVSSDAICVVEECLPEDVPEEAVSCIGHPDTAAVVSDILGREILCNRVSISLSDGDVLYVAQLTGGRLPEGATSLPEGFSISFRKVTVRC